jgi:hypothetical protein
VLVDATAVLSRAIKMPNARLVVLAINSVQEPFVCAVPEAVIVAPAEDVVVTLASVSLNPPISGIINAILFI